jgi:superfamily II DNA or RNA helicase
MLDAARERVRVHVEAGRRTLVMVRSVEHGERLCGALSGDGVRSRFVFGQDGTPDREEAVRLFIAREIQCLVATGIFDEGIDIPALEALVFADSCKSKIQTLQRVGRGMRAFPGKERVWIDDLVTHSHRWFLQHAMVRLALYKGEGFEVVRA